MIRLIESNELVLPPIKGISREIVSRTPVDKPDKYNDVIQKVSEDSNIVNKFLSCIPSSMNIRVCRHNGVPGLRINNLKKSEANSIIKSLAKKFGYNDTEVRSSGGFTFKGVYIDQSHVVVYDSYGEKELLLELENDGYKPSLFSEMSNKMNQ